MHPQPASEASPPSPPSPPSASPASPSPSSSSSASSAPSTTLLPHGQQRLLTRRATVNAAKAAAPAADSPPSDVGSATNSSVPSSDASTATALTVRSFSLSAIQSGPSSPRRKVPPSVSSNAGGPEASPSSRGPGDRYNAAVDSLFKAAERRIQASETRTVETSTPSPSPAPQPSPKIAPRSTSKTPTRRRSDRSSPRAKTPRNPHIPPGYVGDTDETNRQNSESADLERHLSIVSWSSSAVHSEVSRLYHDGELFGEYFPPAAETQPLSNPLALPATSPASQKEVEYQAREEPNSRSKSSVSLTPSLRQTTARAFGALRIFGFANPSDAARPPPPNANGQGPTAQVLDRSGSTDNILDGAFSDPVPQLVLDPSVPPAPSDVILPAGTTPHTPPPPLQRPPHGPPFTPYTPAPPPPLTTAIANLTLTRTRSPALATGTPLLRDPSSASPSPSSPVLHSPASLPLQKKLPPSPPDAPAVVAGATHDLDFIVARSDTGSPVSTASSWHRLVRIRAPTPTATTTARRGSDGVVANPKSRMHFGARERGDSTVEAVDDEEGARHPVSDEGKWNACIARVEGSLAWFLDWVRGRRR